MIGTEVTVVVHGAQGPTTIRAHITGPAAPVGSWYCDTDWGARCVVAEIDLDVKWLHGWPDSDSDEMKALLVAAALSRDFVPSDLGEKLLMWQRSRFGSMTEKPYGTL